MTMYLRGEKMKHERYIINDEEIEALKIKNQSLRAVANSYKLHYNEAGTEAIKEFAEALKFVWYDNRYDSPDIDFEDLIDTIVEERVGDTE